MRPPSEWPVERDQPTAVSSANPPEAKLSESVTPAVPCLGASVFDLRTDVRM